MLTETGDSAACKTCKARKNYPYNDMHTPAAAGISATSGTLRAAYTPAAAGISATSGTLRAAYTPGSGMHPGSGRHPG